jgi:hypothetical protein
MSFSKKSFIVFLVLLSVTVFTNAQTVQPQPERADISISLNEQFFDAFLETLFKNFKPMEFSVARIGGREVKFENASYRKGECKQVIKLEKEMSGMRTAVRFRDGKIGAPLAFSGSYDIPLIGCVDFTGWADTNVLLEFDKEKQTLIGRVKVNNINLNGVTGLASGILAKLMQSSIDKRVNPTTLLNAEKLSFVFPLESMGGNLKMRATDMRPEITPGELKVKVFYEMSKE